MYVDWEVFNFRTKKNHNNGKSGLPAYIYCTNHSLRKAQGFLIDIFFSLTGEGIVEPIPLNIKTGLWRFLIYLAGYQSFSTAYIHLLNLRRQKWAWS